MRRHKNTTVYMLGLLAGLWLSGAAAQSSPELGPPFIDLQQVSAPGLPERDPDPARDALLAQYAEGRYEEATGTAQALLAQARTQHAEDPLASLPALMDLGASQYAAEEYAAAVTTYGQAVKLLQAGRNSRDPRLAQPLYGLGVAQYAAGDYAPAADNLQRAVFVTRVNDGLNSLTQLQYYDALTESYLALGRYDDAAARQLARIAVVERATDESSAETLVAMEQAAQTFRRMGRYREERDIRRRQLRRIEQSRGYDDIHLVPILRKLAATYRLNYEVNYITIDAFTGATIRVPDRAAIADLERALDILETHPQADMPGEKAALLVELGDYFLTFDQSPRAIRYYKLAYRALAQAGDQARIQALFSRPVPVFLPRPDSAPGVGEQPAAGLPVGVATLEFDLPTTGHPQSVDIKALMPASASLMGARAERAVRDARFRPVINAQGVQRSKNVLYDLKFNYDPSGG